jgi:N6-adenosine-specific RNA methylase IME4
VNRSQDATGPLRLRDLGITKSDSSRAQEIAGLPTASFAQYVSECLKSNQEPTTAGLLRLVKQQKVHDSVAADTMHHDRLVRDLQPLIAAGRRFATIYSDPPWPYENQGTRAATGNHYPTISIEKIAALPVDELAAEHAHLHLWTTNCFLPVALELIKSWGFEHKSCFVWVKPQLGIGNYWRVSHEMLLLGVRGSLPFRDRGQRSWLELDRRGHSVKPPEIRSLIEKTSPPNYIELFAREVPENPAWTVYGNQFNRRI